MDLIWPPYHLKNVFLQTNYKSPNSKKKIGKEPVRIRNLSTAKNICIVLFLAARLRLSKFSVKKIVANKRLYLSRQKKTTMKLYMTK